MSAAEHEPRIDPAIVEFNAAWAWWESVEASRSFHTTAERLWLELASWRLTLEAKLPPKNSPQ